LYGFQLLLSVGALIEFYFKLIICITITEEPKKLVLLSRKKMGHRQAIEWDSKIKTQGNSSYSQTLTGQGIT